MFRILGVTHITFEFKFYKVVHDLLSSEMLWCVNGTLCEVEDELEGLCLNI